MLDQLPPATILVVGALLVPILRGRLQSLYLLALPVVSFAHLLSMSEGSYGHILLFDYSLMMVRVDKLSLVFGYIFHIMAILGVVYALHMRDNVQHMSGLIYAGSAIAGAFAGDLITLFVFWELTAISSVFLIWSSRTERAYRAGMRYLIIQVGSGVSLLSGVLIHYHKTGSLAFGNLAQMYNLESFALADFGSEHLGPTLIFIAFGMKCAFPFLHNWLQDAYPEATVTGTVLLSAFTTKLAIYTFARAFPGTATASSGQTYPIYKNRLLELYLNTVFYGADAYGIADAAQIYFGRTAAELDLPRAALLMGIINAPG